MRYLPENCSDDLRRKLEAVLGYRIYPRPAEIWNAVREWLLEGAPSDGVGSAE